MSKLLDLYHAWQRQPRLLKWVYRLVGLVVLYFMFDFAIMPLYTRQYQSIEVPDITRKPWEEAVQILQQNGLEAVKGPEKYDETLPPGYVLFQNPGVDLPVKKGRRVYLTLSKGPRLFKMPKLVGLSERDARFILEQEELALAEVAYRSDSFYPEGVVCAQSIEPGEDVTIGRRIYLAVSLGMEPNMYIVPDVVGKSQKEAIYDVLRAGLMVGEITEQATEELVPYTVVSQSPESGTIVEKGDRVDIVITMVPE